MRARSACGAIVAIVVGSGLGLMPTAAAVTPYDGDYQGRYSGADSGAVHLVVKDGVITVDEPITASSRVGAGGAATFSGKFDVEGVTCTFVGSFSLTGPGSAGGRWQCGSFASGTWEVTRRSGAPSSGSPSAPTPTTQHTVPVTLPGVPAIKPPEAVPDVLLKVSARSCDDLKAKLGSYAAARARAQAALRSPNLSAATRNQLNAIIAGANECAKNEAAVAPVLNQAQQAVNARDRANQNVERLRADWQRLDATAKDKERRAAEAAAKKASNAIALRREATLARTAANKAKAALAAAEKAAVRQQQAAQAATERCRRFVATKTRQVTFRCPGS